MVKKILMVLADGFEEVEAFGTVDFLRRTGLDVVTAGLKRVAVSGAHGIKTTADTTLAAVRVQEFDALALPGGMPGSMNLYESDSVLEAVQCAYQSGRIVAAICAAPIVLGRAGLLVNRTFTCYPGIEQRMTGVKPTSRMVECDGRVITGKGPGATFMFAAKIAAELGCGAAAVKAAAEMFVSI
ncbi:MAG: DJ-1/PfpI family protein [Victivallaceae bacterium]|nr:DJ-1/PfpI family protein [Victivallaceae bacterium]